MSTSSTAEVRFLQTARYGDAKVILVLIEAYFDESGTGPNDLAHCLAGYIIKPEYGLKMESKWREILSKYNIPFFHMTDCAAYQRCEPYKSLGREKCISLASDLIWLIKVHCMEGFAICFSPRDYAIYEHQMIGTENLYSFSVNFSHIHIQSLISSSRYKGYKANYVFEAGHRDQKNARSVLDKLLDDAGKDGTFSYSFKNKQDSVLLQAADILAWHCNQYVKRRSEGKPVRKDFLSLLDIPHKIIHLSNPIVDGVKEPTTTTMTWDTQPQNNSADLSETIKQIYKLGGIVPQN